MVHSGAVITRDNMTWYWCSNKMSGANMNNNLYLPNSPQTPDISPSGIICCRLWGSGGYSWWRHQMETFSALLALRVGNSPVTGEFPSRRPVTRRFDVFLDLRLNKRLSKQSTYRWFETPSRSLWRHSNVTALLRYRTALIFFVTLPLLCYISWPNWWPWDVESSSQWRHNERHGVSNHRRLDCLLRSLFRGRFKKTSKLHVTCLCEGKSPAIGEFPPQRASNRKCFHLMTSSCITRISQAGNMKNGRLSFTLSETNNIFIWQRTHIFLFFNHHAMMTPLWRCSFRIISPLWGIPPCKRREHYNWFFRFLRPNTLLDKQSRC